MRASREGRCEWEALSTDLWDRHGAALAASMDDADRERLSPEECDGEIEARRVCRRHYHKLKRLRQAAGPLEQSASAQAAAEVAVGVQSGIVPAAKVASVVDYEVYQDYAQDPKDKRKKNMAAGLVWIARAKVDVDAGERSRALPDEEILRRHSDRVTAFIEEEAKRQGKSAKRLLAERGRQEALAHLLWNPGHRREAGRRFDQEVTQQIAGDWREAAGLDRVHARRIRELRTIDMVSAARRIGLGDSPDMGSPDVLRQVIEAIEDGRVKS